MLLSEQQRHHLSCPHNLAVNADGASDGPDTGASHSALSLHCIRQLAKLLPTQQGQHTALKLTAQLAPLLQLALLLRGYEGAESAPAGSQDLSCDPASSAAASSAGSGRGCSSGSNLAGSGLGATTHEHQIGAHGAEGIGHAQTQLDSASGSGSNGPSSMPAQGLVDSHGAVLSDAAAADALDAVSTAQQHCVHGSIAAAGVTGDTAGATAATAAPAEAIPAGSHHRPCLLSEPSVAVQKARPTLQTLLNPASLLALLGFGDSPSPKLEQEQPTAPSAAPDLPQQHIWSPAFQSVHSSDLHPQALAVYQPVQQQNTAQHGHGVSSPALGPQQLSATQIQIESHSAAQHDVLAMLGLAPQRQDAVKGLQTQPGTQGDRLQMQQQARLALGLVEVLLEYALSQPEVQSVASTC